MSTITTSITLTGDILSSYTWPITINSGVTVTLGSDISLTSNSQYFIIGGSNVTFNGLIYKIIKHKKSHLTDISKDHIKCFSNV